MYNIVITKASRIVTLTLSGFWTVEVARRFVADQELAVAKLGPPYGTHLTLVDARRFEVQQREVVAIIRELVVNARSRSKRIALVGEGAGLAKMQFARIIERRSSRMFLDVDEARSWLLSSDDAAI